MDPLILNTLTTAAQGATLVGTTAAIPNEIKVALLKPSADAIGNAFGLLINHLVQPTIRLGIRDEQKINEYKKSLDDKLNAIPKGRIDTSRVLDAVEITQNSINRIDNDLLRDMFAQLLANAFDTEKQKTVRINFSRILQSLEPKDAQLLRDLKGGHKAFAYTSARVALDRGQYLPAAVPFQMISLNDNSIATVGTSLQTIESFGLVEIVTDTKLTDTTLYEKMDNNIHFQHYKTLNSVTFGEYNKQKYGETGNTVLHRGVVQVTPLGEEFLMSVM